MSSTSYADGARRRSLGASSDLRLQVITGLVLAVAAALLLLAGALFDLELDAVVLLGVTLGAVVALAPGATAPTRLAGFAGGVLAALVGYLARAQFLPDTAGGRSVAVLLTVALCVAVVAIGLGRLPLWSVLLGAGALAGAYEAAYAAAPPRVLDTSPSAVTALLLTAAVGWLVCSLLAPRETAVHERRVPGMRRADASEMDELETTESDDETTEVAR